MSQPVDVREVLKTFHDTKNRKNFDWREVAGAFQRIRASGLWRQHYESHSAWLEAASSETDYSIGMLQRMLASYQFLALMEKGQSAVCKKLLDIEKVEKLSLSTIEYAKRIYDIDPQQGLDTLKKVAMGEVTFTNVRDDYEGLIRSRNDAKRSMERHTVSPGKLGLRKAHQKLDDMRNAVEARALLLVDDPQAQVCFNKYKFKFVAPNGVIIGRKGAQITHVDGVDFRIVRVPGHYKQLLAEVVFASSFFRSYWLIVPKDGTRPVDNLLINVDKLLKDLPVLGIGSVGIAAIQETTNPSLEVLHRPERAEISSRQDFLIDEIYRQGINSLRYGEGPIDLFD